MPPTVPSVAAGSWGKRQSALRLRVGGEVLLATLVLVAAGWLAWSGGRLALGQQVAGWGLVLLAAAVLVRRGWLKLFGPVLFYDLVCLSRRGRYTLLRLLYALAILLILFVVHRSFQQAHPSGRVTNRELAAFATSFFHAFMIGQFAAVLLLTPAYTAAAIAEEKERRTLEFLLATDLDNREIVLSKLASRLANLALLLLTGLPILALTQFWGGVDPDLVLAGFAATGLTLASLASLSILNSVYARKPREAVVLTYLSVAGYFGLALLSEVLLRYPALAAMPLLAKLVEGLNAGNIVAVLAQLRGTAVVPRLLRNYALFHGLLTGLCAAWAVVRLRAVAVRQTQDSPRAAPRRRRLRFRGRIGDEPMLWKEIVTEPGLTFNRAGRVLVGLIILVSFVPAVWIAGSYLLEALGWFKLLPGPRPYGDPWLRLGGDINRWVKGVGTLVACLTLLGVAVRAAGSVTGERDRQTLDSLLTTPLTARAILSAKWLGSLLSVRWAGLWLGLIWLVGIGMGGLDSTSVPWLVLAWVVYGGFLASLGLWFSVTSRTSLRAVVYTLAVTAAITFGHWLPLTVYRLAMPPSWPNRMASNQLVQFQVYGLTPPVALGWLSFRSEDFRTFEWLLDLLYGGFAWSANPWDAFVGLAGGLVFWAVAAGLLFGFACRRFAARVGRGEGQNSVRRPLEVWDPWSMP